MSKQCVLDLSSGGRGLGTRLGLYMQLTRHKGQRSSPWFFCLPLSLPFGRKSFELSVNYTTRLTQHNLLPVCTHNDNIPIYYVCCAGIEHNTVELSILNFLNCIFLNHVAGNFRGRKLQRIGEMYSFHRENFRKLVNADCSFLLCQRTPCPQLSRIATKP